MGIRKDNAPEFYWYQKLRVLLDETSPLHETFLFWCGVIGGADSQQLLNVDAFCALGKPEAIEWTQENFLNYSCAEILDSYAQNVIYERFCKEPD